VACTEVKYVQSCDIWFCRSDVNATCNILGLYAALRVYYSTDVSRQPIGPVFNGQAFRRDGTDRLSRNVGTDLPSYAAQNHKNAQVFCTGWWENLNENDQL